MKLTNLLVGACFFTVTVLSMSSCEKMNEDDPSTISLRPDTTTYNVNPSQNDKPSGQSGSMNTKGETADIHPGDTVSVSDFIRKNIDCTVYVKGYIVGTCYRNHGNTTLEPPFDEAGSTSVLIADRRNEKNTEEMMCIKLKNGTMKTAWNLQDNPENYGREVVVMGVLDTYLGYPAIRDLWNYELR